MEQDLCGYCTQLFTQPLARPRSRDSWEEDAWAHQKRSGESMRVSASAGCWLCRFVYDRICTLIGLECDVDAALIGPHLTWNTEESVFTGLVYRVDAMGSVYPELFHLELYLESCKAATLSIVLGLNLLSFMPSCGGHDARIS